MIDVNYGQCKNIFIASLRTTENYKILTKIQGSKWKILTENTHIA